MDSLMYCPPPYGPMDGQTARVVVNEARKKEIPFLAASVAFYAFFSFVPLLILGLAVASAVGGAPLEERLLEFVGVYLSEEGETVVGEALTDTSGRSAASAAGFVALSWGSLKVFRAVDIAFDRVYGADGRVSLVQRMVDASVVLASVGIGVGIMVVFGATVAGFEGAYGVVGWLALVGGLAAVFAPLYYVMPPDRVAPRETLPGLTVAVAGWLLLQGLFGLYTSSAVRYQAYGFLGAVLLFLLWLYLGAMAILLGGVVNAVTAQD